jgi:predicted phosphodiesterase
MAKIKILLISDLHLGLERINPWISAEERLSTFRNIISLAREHDILMVAGDLINDSAIDSSYYDLIEKEFSSLLSDGKEIYYCTGAGELTGEGFLDPLIRRISTTFTFSDTSSNYVYKSSFGELFIYGLQNTGINDKWDIARKTPEGFHIGLFYADFSPQLAGAPDIRCIKKDDMKKMNLDFFALGKSHTFKMFKSSSKILGACPGSAEPCSMNEYGDRYAVSLEVEDGELRSIKRIAVNTVKIMNEEIDCRIFSGQQELVEKIKSTWAAGSLININLAGERNFLINDNFRMELVNFFRKIVITDCSVPSLEVLIDENRGSDSLKGFFYRNLKEQIPGGKMDSRLLASIILKKNIKNKTECAIICDS